MKVGGKRIFKSNLGKSISNKNHIKETFSNQILMSDNSAFSNVMLVFPRNNLLYIIKKAYTNKL